MGLERTGGFETVAFCEICHKARKVLKKHWADVPIYEDIKTLTLEKLTNDGIPKIDCITGGFPCQDISGAGKGKGIIGKRSGLWSEMCRIIEDVQPRWVIAENVSALRSKGLTLVLQDISSLGYHAEWHCIPASAVGAHHQRDRIWIIAEISDTLRKHSPKRGERSIIESEGASGSTDEDRGCGDVERKRPLRGAGVNTSSELSYSNSKFGRDKQGHQTKKRLLLSGEPEGGTLGRTVTGCGALPRAECWAAEPSVGRVAHGIPNRVDRLKQLGNSVVPQIPELIGNAILEVEHGCFIGQE